MDYRDDLVGVIHRAARAIVGARVPIQVCWGGVVCTGRVVCTDDGVRGHVSAPTVCIQVVAGHSHIRAYSDLDPRAAAFEPGHYLDTVGFASFALGGNASFAHVFIDANVATMAAAAGLDGPAALATPSGTALSASIARVASSLRLDRRLGCSPGKFRAYAALDSADSLWGLYLYNVTATLALGGNRSRLVLESTGSLRYDMYAGSVTSNDLWTITPFADRFWRVAERVSGEAVAAIVHALNGRSSLESSRGPQERTHAVSDGRIPAYVTTSEPVPGTAYELWTLDFDLVAVSNAFEAQAKQRASPKLMRDGANTTSLWESWIERSWPCSQLV